MQIFEVEENIVGIIEAVTVYLGQDWCWSHEDPS